MYSSRWKFEDDVGPQDSKILGGGGGGRSLPRIATKQWPGSNPGWIDAQLNPLLF